jgi:integrase
VTLSAWFFGSQWRAHASIMERRFSIMSERGHLDKLLTKRPKGERPHHPAMPYADVAAFLAEVRQVATVAARALEFCILTASRTGEVLGSHAATGLPPMCWSSVAGLSVTSFLSRMFSLR